MRLDVLPHSTGRHPECSGDLLQCEQLQRSGHGTNSMNTASSGTPTEIAVGSDEPMDGFRAMSGSLVIGSEWITQNKLARMLKPPGIAPDHIDPETRVRGYKPWQFEEAFSCYLRRDRAFWSRGRLHGRRL